MAPARGIQGWACTVNQKPLICHPSGSQSVNKTNGKAPYSPNSDFSQDRGSYLACIIVPLESKIAGCQPRYLSLGT